MQGPARDGERLAGPPVGVHGPRSRDQRVDERPPRVGSFGQRDRAIGPLESALRSAERHVSAPEGGHDRRELGVRLREIPVPQGVFQRLDRLRDLPSVELDPRQRERGAREPRVVVRRAIPGQRVAPAGLGDVPAPEGARGIRDPLSEGRTLGADRTVISRACSA